MKQYIYTFKMNMDRSLLKESNKIFVNLLKTYITFLMGKVKKN
jgi:hypothetical protein